MLDIGSRLDILSRIIAHERTLKRGIHSGQPLPIAGGACTNSDICGFLQRNVAVDGTGWALIQTLAHDALDEILDSGHGLAATESLLRSTDNDVQSNGRVIADVLSRIGSAGSGFTTLGAELDSTHGLASTASSNATLAYSETLGISASLPYPNVQATDVHADINRAIASILLGITLSDLIKDAVGTITDPIGTLLQTIELAFPNHTGDVTTINYNTQLIDNGQPPPITSLTQGSALTLGDGVNVEIPVGTYAYSFEFDVPDYWGTRGFFTQDKTPSIAVLDWLRDAYSFDNPKYIRRTAWLAFPLHPAANRFTVDLTPGVTGTYTPWTL